METIVIPEDLFPDYGKLRKEMEADILEEARNNPEGYVKWSERFREIDKPCRIKLC